MKPAEFDAAIARIKADLEAAKQRAIKSSSVGKPPASGNVTKWSDL
jgi:hypothetical protein